MINKINVDGVDHEIISESAEKKIAEMSKTLGMELEKKAPKIGSAPNLKVGFAKELVGRGEATEEVIGGIRPTGVRSIGDGNATIAKIKGESVVWNQWVKMSGVITAFGLTYSAHGLDGIRISGTPTSNGDIRLTFEEKNAPDGHKILVRSNAKGLRARCQGQGNWLYNQIITARDVDLFDIVVCCDLPTNQAVDFVFYPEIVDLTQMFGSGKEPTTIEDFEARKPLGVTNEYNEGTIVSYDGSALKSVGFNAFTAENSEQGSISTTSGLNITSTSAQRSDFLPCVGNAVYEFINVHHMYEYDADRKFIRHFSLADANFKPVTKSYTLTDKTRYIRVVYSPGDESSVCVHLTHSGYRNGEYAPYEADTHLLPDVTSILDANGNKLFPHGLLSAGSVHDEITATKAIKRVGVVDLGMLSWTRSLYGEHYLFLQSIDDSSTRAKLLTAPYYTESTNIPRASQSNKSVKASPSEKIITIRDDAYTDVADFKAAMSGVLLYYELAEPIEVDLPEPLNMTYEAWDFGTEELVADGKTTPLNADIVYQFNAVDRIRENSSAIDDLEAHVEERKDDGIERLTNGNLKLTLKGATREFMPATPSGDPMHWAYITAGAEYNATDATIQKTAPWGEEVDHLPHHYYLNGLGDITKEQMRGIYNAGAINSADNIGRFHGANIRTNLKPSIGMSGEEGYGNYSFGGCFTSSSIEVAYLSRNNMIKTSSSFYACFSSASRLRYIYPTINVSNVSQSHLNSFNYCKSLIGVKLLGIQYNLDWRDSGSISKESVLYSIQNATPTTAITITLHHDAYERLKGDADILQALTTKNADLATKGDGKVSLVCATEGDTIPTE